jgi:terminase large subunit-like protein
LPKIQVAQRRFKRSDLLGNTPAKIQNDLAGAREFELGLITGFAAGKTRGICAAAIEHGVRYPKAKVLLGRKTYQETVNTVKQPFFEMGKVLADAGWFTRPLKWDYREGTNHAQLANGSQFIFSNLDDPVKFRNEEYSMVIVDQAEEINQELWEVLIARIRWPYVPADARQAIAAANDNGHNWVWRRFVDEPGKHAVDEARCLVDPFCMFRAGHPDDDDVPRPWLPCATRRFFHGTTLDNKHNLAPKYLSILLSHPAEWQKRFIYATMESSEGRLLPDPTVVDDFTPPAHWPKWRALDHALNSPACCLWLTVNVDPTAVRGVNPDAVFVYREYYQDNRSVDQHAKAILRLSGKETYHGEVMDRSAFQLTQSRTGGVRVSIADIYREESGGRIMWSPSVGDPFARVERIVACHNRGLVVARSCQHLIKQMPEYYAEAARTTGIYRIVNKSDFHSVDALGYGLMIIPLNMSADQVNDDKPDYLRKSGVDELTQRHNMLEWKRFKKIEERNLVQENPFDRINATEFWGEDAEPEIVTTYDPMYGGGRAV